LASATARQRDAAARNQLHAIYRKLRDRARFAAVGRLQKL
jgi:hypothetical protein